MAKLSVVIDNDATVSCWSEFECDDTVELLSKICEFGDGKCSCL